MQPHGNYIILNDLDFKDYTYQALGWGYRYFYGKIDFQGYSATLYSKTGNTQRLGTIEKTGILKNVVLNYHINNEVNSSNVRGFVSNNMGTIENIMVNIYDDRARYFDDLYTCVVADSNALTGKIRNFALNLKTRLNLYWEVGLVSRNNYGLIENGYVQGENAFVTNARSGASSRNVSLVQKYGGLKFLLLQVLNSLVIFPMI